MLAVTVTLLHGTIRAGSPDDTVHAGGDPVGEWPPSPARLFGALVASDGTGERCTATSGEELRWLECLSPPHIHASASTEVQLSALLPRYAVVDESHEGAVQDYPARKVKLVRPGMKMSPHEPTVTYCWPGATPDEGVVAALRYRAARIGYLGCADSPVRVRIGNTEPDVAPNVWEPDRSANFTLPVPYEGFLDALDSAYLRWSSGEAMGRAWIPTRRAGYRGPDARDRRGAVVPSASTTIWLRFNRSIGSRSLLHVTQTLRAAVTDHFQRVVGEADVPSIIHGHRPDGVEGPQACFIALPDVGQPHASGRLFGAAITLLRECDPALMEQMRAAVFRLADQGLVLPSGTRLALLVHGGEHRPWTANPRRWSRPSICWVSVTPVVHERWSRHGPDRAEVARWCAHAGLPPDIAREEFVSSVEISRHPLVPGALDVPPALIFRSGRERRPYSHMRITFARPVSGPLVLGRSRQLGFGLFAPDATEGGPSDG